MSFAHTRTDAAHSGRPLAAGVFARDVACGSSTSDGDRDPESDVEGSGAGLGGDGASAYPAAMRAHRTGQVAVIFASTRTADDDAGYAAAADAMEALAAVQPGYRGIDSVRGPDGRGITVSYWADDAAAIAWRDHPDHRTIRDRGRARWYADYAIVVARVERDYDWTRP